MDHWHAATSRIEIARRFIKAKFDKSEVVLDHLKQRYPYIAYDFSEDIEELKVSKSIRELMSVEGGVVWKYWNEFSKAIPEKYLLFFLATIDRYN
jgi:CRISPR-associated protein Cas1